MSATIIGDVVAGAVAAIAAADITSRGNDLKIYDHEPRDLDTLPALTIEGPVRFRRVDPDEAESQLGSRDWHLGFTARLYVAFDSPSMGALDARALLGQVIAAIDADETLGGVALSAVIESGELAFTTEDAPRQMAIYDTALEVWALVA